MQYADDTTIYKPVKNFSDNVSDGIKQAVEWSKCNNMLLNNDKTVILNVAFSEKDGIDNPISFDNTDIVPSNSAKFLGVTVDRTLTFSEHVSKILSKCNSRIFLMKQLKQINQSVFDLWSLRMIYSKTAIDNCHHNLTLLEYIIIYYLPEVIGHSVFHNSFYHFC